ncbi:MAG: hypothetical protein RI560_00755 [Natronomonas sp.]|jgi:hypothetical protein|uniref:DUF7127 family protein n=1 Tax=Natronomonas sp. TaxID=2184060 RepID=UPI0028702D52|nr:hypothetical protein [Natronomonas sp.]MDR9380190.1 hypothetical protein [Natronomonas sp.]MDR9430375.1 hypothetical protein [Natronomonas sp.]
MTEYTQSIRGDIDAVARHYEYDDSAIIVADFGFVTGSVDVVDDTAIVVIDDDQYEFDVPAGVDRAVMNNGVVSIEVER